jgi:predicted acetyltransferase
MPVEYGVLDDSWLERFAWLSSYVFGYPWRGEENMQRARHGASIAVHYGATEGDLLISKVANLHRRMYINGVQLACGAVAGVGTVPERRREGHLGKLLRMAFSDMRDAGECVSMLYPTFFGLYQRFGYRMASMSARYQVTGADLALSYGPESPGCVERVDGAEQWPRLRAVYEQVAADRNGWFVRDEWAWKRITSGTPDEEPPFFAVYSDDGGDRGYLCWTREGLRQPGPNQKFKVLELVAQDAEAYVGLLRFLQAHDLAVEIAFETVPLDDPLPDLTANPRYLNAQTRPHVMLRVVDVEAAIAQRPVLDQAVEGALVLEVQDRDCPWNAGRWRLEAGAGKASVQRTDAVPDLSLEVGALAVLFNGFRSATRLARCGLLETENAAALVLADRIFETDWQPICLDYF